MSTKDAGGANKCDQADDYSTVKLFIALCDREDFAHLKQTFAES